MTQSCLPRRSQRAAEMGGIRPFARTAPDDEVCAETGRSPGDDRSAQADPTDDFGHTHPGPLLPDPTADLYRGAAPQRASPSLSTIPSDSSVPSCPAARGVDTV